MTPSVANAEAVAAPQTTPTAEIFPSDSVALIIAMAPNGIEAKNMTFVIHRPSLTRIGDRWFILGKPTADAGKPHLQFVSKLAVAWEHVIEFSVFTPDGFAEFVEEMKTNAER